MEVQDSDFLKKWREKLGVSQKRFAELAKISLTTLRQFEIGSHKPQRKTLKKLTEIMQGIEAGKFEVDSNHPTKTRNQRSNSENGTEMLSDVNAPELLTPKRRGRPPRAGRLIHETKIVAPVKDANIQNSHSTSPIHSQTIQPIATNGLGVIQLSNLDLELINRVLNMSGKDKLSLLSQLM